MSPYIRFCSCQLNAAALIQRKTENSNEFKDLQRVSLVKEIKSVKIYKTDSREFKNLQE